MWRTSVWEECPATKSNTITLHWLLSWLTLRVNILIACEAKEPGCTKLIGHQNWQFLMLSYETDVASNLRIRTLLAWETVARSDCIIPPTQCSFIRAVCTSCTPVFVAVYSHPHTYTCMRVHTRAHTHIHHCG